MAAIFADIKTPYVNELTLKRNLVPKVKENIFQGIVLRPGEACTDKFSTDTDAAELQIIRIKPNDKGAREIGADINGGYFNGEEAAQPNSEAYPIRILTTIDYNIDIPTNAQDMINVDLAEAEMQNLSGKVNRNVNAMTLAAQLKTYLNGLYEGKTDAKVEIDLTNVQKGDYKNAILDAGAYLDAGNEEQGIDMYPSDERAILIRAKVRSALMRDGDIIIGGSNYAQDILADGGLSHGEKRFGINGFAGYVDGTPVYVVSDPVFNLCADYLGLDKAQLGDLLGVVVSAIGTGRALAFNSVMKTIPSPQGQGVRLQPKYRMGAECWDSHSVIPIVAKTFVNPVVSAETKLTVIAPASRPGYVAVTLNVKDGGSNAADAVVTATSGARVSTGKTDASGNVTLYVYKGSAGTLKAVKGAKQGSVAWTAGDSGAAFNKSVTLA